MDGTVTRALARHELDDRQSVFISAIIDGAKPGEAKERAGYGATVPASYVMAIPRVAAALHEAMALVIKAEVPTNLAVLRKIRDDDGAPAGVRADIAMKLTRLAGHIEPAKGDDGGPTKQLAEMTADELRDWRAKNQAEIDRLEAELAARATPVNAPASTPNKPARKAKPKQYLD